MLVHGVFEDLGEQRRVSLLHISISRTCVFLVFSRAKSDGAIHSMVAVVAAVDGEGGG